MTHWRLENVRSMYFYALHKPCFRVWQNDPESLTQEQTTIRQLDAVEIMWTLDTKQNPNQRLENSQGKRKNFPTISVCIPYEGQSRDASSEVCGNQWVYMHRVLLALVCVSVEATLMILCMNTYYPVSYETGLNPVRTVGIPVSPVIWFHGCSLYTTEGESATTPKSHVLIQDGFMSFKIVLQNANILFFIFWSLEWALKYQQRSTCHQNWIVTWRSGLC